MSIEEKVEEFYKAKLDEYRIRHYGKTELVNRSIGDALSRASSKSGNCGYNYPDIKLLLTNNLGRCIPVMIEAKGSKGKLEKLTKDGDIELISDSKNPYRAVTGYAVNGALHYGNAILAEGTYKEVVIVGVNGTTVARDGFVSDPETKAYYVSKKNECVPKEIKDFDFVLMKRSNIDSFYAMLDELSLTREDVEKVKRNKEEILEQNIKNIHQRIYDDESIRNLLSINDKLYFFCGLIMCGLSVEGLCPLDVDDFKGNTSVSSSDGTKVISQVISFLEKKNCSQDKIDLIVNYLKPVFDKCCLWEPVNGESLIKSIYKQVKTEIIPLLESSVHLDFTGKILNSLNDWASIDNDRLNDVVLTPRFVTDLMARICCVDENSCVWDTCMGSAGFLVSAMNLMIADAKYKHCDNDEFVRKVENIKQNQLFGVEILGNIYILAVLNMILMGDGSSRIVCGDAHREIDFVSVESENGGDETKNKKNKFCPNVFLLNPPYSAPGKGLIFVDEALSRMKTGYAAVLIQENAGSGNGGSYSEHLLKNNTLVASVHMPSKLFNGKASVQTAIYLFKVNRPHEEDDVVTFIDFSEDGYARQNRRRSTQAVNLRNANNALERYDEVVALCLGKKPRTEYYTESNGKVIKDTITLKGNDWTFSQHKKIDNVPTEEDFKKTVSDYLAWKVGAILKGQVSTDV